MQSSHEVLYDEYETDLMAECQTNENSLKDMDIQKQKLKQENKMKQKALDKASALIDLLTVELAINKKSFEQVIEGLKDDVLQKQHQQFKLREQIKMLQQRNGFLEFECKKRTTEVKMSRSNSRSSLKSLGRSPSQQNSKTVIKYRKADSISKLSPPTHKKKQQQKQLSVDYMWILLKEHIQQDFQLNNFINNVLGKQSFQCDNIVEKLTEHKQFTDIINNIKSGISSELQDMIIYKMQQMKGIIFDQKNIIQRQKRMNSEYERIISQLLSHKHSNNQPSSLTFAITSIQDMNILLSSKSHQIKDKILISTTNYKNNTNEIQILINKINQYSKFNHQIKQIFDAVSDGTNQEDLICKIKCMKSNQSRLQKENKQLINITDGLLKYIKY